MVVGRDRIIIELSICHVAVNPRMSDSYIVPKIIADSFNHLLGEFLDAVLQVKLSNRATVADRASAAGIRNDFWVEKERFGRWLDRIPFEIVLQRNRINTPLGYIIPSQPQIP